MRLAAVLLLMFWTAYEARVEARVIAERQIELSVGSGRSLMARVQVPVRAEPMPAVILLGGLERGASALDLVRPERPTVMASFDYPLNLPPEIVWSSAFRVLPDVRRGIRDSLEGIGALHAALKQLPEVDPDRITVVGVSLGAPFAVIAAADHNIPGLAIIHGFADVPGVIAHQLIRHWAPERGGWARPLARGIGWVLTLAAGIPSVEPRAAGLRREQKVLMLTASDDELIPVSATQALLEGLRRSDATTEFEVERGRHLAGADDPRIPRLLQRTERWFALSGL